MKIWLLTILLAVSLSASTKVLEINKDFAFAILCIDNYKWMWTYDQNATKMQQMYETNTVIRRSIPASCN